MPKYNKDGMEIRICRICKKEIVGAAYYYAHLMEMHGFKKLKAGRGVAT